MRHSGTDGPDIGFEDGSAIAISLNPNDYRCTVSFAEWNSTDETDIQHDGYTTTEAYEHGAT